MENEVMANEFIVKKGLEVVGNITSTGTVNGRTLATDGAKIDSIETGAKGDQTASEIKTAYESNADTNAFLNAEKTKLANVTATQAVNLDTIESDTVTNNAKVGITAAQASAILTNTAKVSDINHNVTTNLSVTTAATTLAVVSSDGTDALLPAATTTVAGVMSGADKSKLNGVATGATANVGDITGVTAGTGMSGGGTSGAVTLTNSAPNIVQTTVTGSSGSCTGNAATASNAALLDNLDSTKFPRETGRVSGNVTAGWITVAQVTNARHHGEIVVSDAESGDHSFIRMDWICSYGSSNVTVISRDGYSDRITGARVLYDTANKTYGNHKLQIYSTTTSTYSVQSIAPSYANGWGGHTLVTPILQNTITGYAVNGATLSSMAGYGFGCSNGIKTGGNILASGNITAYSDIRLKEDLKLIPNALSKVKQLNGYTYKRNDLDDKEARHTGVIAQEVLEVLPEAVQLGATSEDTMSVAYGNMVGLLIESIKELELQVKELRAGVALNKS